MPQLRSGRHVALAPTPILERLRYGTDLSVSGLIVAFRMSVGCPAELLDHVPVGYFREGEGEPPDAPAYGSGFNVRQVLNGEAGWTAEEIEEFRQWLAEDPRLDAWLAEQFEAIDAAIRDNLVWDTPLWTDDESQRPDQ